MMRKLRRLLSILVPVLALGCTVKLTPKAPEPKPVVVAPVPPTPAPVVDPIIASCDSACLNLTMLGGCDAMPITMSCQAACERLNGQKDANGNQILALDTGCLTKATSCEAVKLCD